MSKEKEEEEKRRLEPPEREVARAKLQDPNAVAEPWKEKKLKDGTTVLVRPKKLTDGTPIERGLDDKWLLEMENLRRKAAGELLIE